MMVLKVVLQGW